MVDDVVTIELEQREYELLKDAVRWSKERCKEKGLKRTQRKLDALQDTLSEVG